MKSECADHKKSRWNEQVFLGRKRVWIANFEFGFEWIDSQSQSNPRFDQERFEVFYDYNLEHFVHQWWSIFNAFVFLFSKFGSTVFLFRF